MIPLLAVEITNNQLLAGGAVGTMTVFLFLMKFNAMLKTYIRDVNNQKPEGREILGQPIKFSMDEKVMTEGTHRAVYGSLHHRVGALESDVRMIRSKMDADKNEIISSGEERAKDLHRRIDGLPHQIIALLKDTKGLLE